MLTAGKIRMLLAIAIVAAIAGIVVVAMKRLPTQVPQSSTTTTDVQRQSEVTLRGIRVNESSNGSTKWTLVAATAEYDSRRGLVDLADVRLSVAPIDKSLGELVLTSPTAVYNTTTRDVSLTGGVKAKSSRGMEFSTRSVNFLGGRGVVTTVDAVRFSDEDLTLEGTGMEYNIASSALRVTSNVTATMRGGKHR